jgi:hypothetical protein
VPGVQVRDKFDASAQAAAADVEKIMTRLESLCAKKLELSSASLFPKAADIASITK